MQGTFIATSIFRGRCFVYGSILGYVDTLKKGVSRDCLQFILLKNTRVYYC